MERESGTDILGCGVYTQDADWLVNWPGFGETAAKHRTKISLQSIDTSLSS
jgi:hypothetical protein